MSFNREYTMFYVLRTAEIACYVLVVALVGAWILAFALGKPQQAEARDPTIIAASREEYAILEVRNELRLIREELKLLRIAVQPTPNKPETRKVWKQVREPVQIEGMIDDGYELVEETK